MKRRDFFTSTWQLASIGALGSFVGACSNSPTAPSNVPALTVLTPPVVNGTITLTIDANSPLQSVGSAALLQTSGGYVLVAHTAQNTFNAMTAICTHQGCVISGYSSSLFVCPCHGSQYNTGGSVVQGPAVGALARYATQFTNGALTIAL